MASAPVDASFVQPWKIVETYVKGLSSPLISVGSIGDDLLDDILHSIAEELSAKCASAAQTIVRTEMAPYSSTDLAQLLRSSVLSPS